MNECVYVNYESASWDFFFNRFTLLPMLQGIPIIIIIINFKKEGGASVVHEVFFFFFFLLHEVLWLMHFVASFPFEDSQFINL